MKTSKKIILSVMLIVFISISVFASFNMISRETFEFAYSEEEGGYVFEGFNGNADITEVIIDKLLVKTKTNEGTKWIPDENSVVVAVDQYNIISDEYIEHTHIGRNVKRIDEKAFVYCKALKSITVDPANEYYVDIDGVLFTKDLSVLLAFPICHETNGERTKDYTIPDGVVRLAKNSFYKCEALSHVYFPDTIIEIGDMSFFKCWWLQLIELPPNVKTIGSDAFSYCTGFRYSFFIPESVENIGHHAFYKSDAIEVFYIGGSEDSIELGGKWQPKSENALRAEKPIFNSTIEECREYTLRRAIEEGEFDVAEQPAEEVTVEEGVTGEETTQVAPVQNNNNNDDGMNKVAVILILIFVMLPSFAIIGTEVIRNLFKEDFLMTKKGKERLKKHKEEKEYIRQMYLNLGDKEEKEEENNNGKN